jgi:hypothetical protein
VQMSKLQDFPASVMRQQAMGGDARKLEAES